MRWGMAVLIGGAVVLAAPVPKKLRAMTELYGELTSAKEECVAEIDRSGKLTLTVPTTATPQEPGNVYSVVPHVAKRLEGDFTVTTRMRIDFPEGAKTRSKGTPAAAHAGLTVFSGDPKQFSSINGQVITFGVSGPKSETTIRRGLEWNGDEMGGGHGGGGRSLSSMVFQGDTVYFRISRKGHGVTMTSSTDGQKWEKAESWTIKGVVQIGPVAYGCLDKEFSATFDEYEVQVEEKK